MIDRELILKYALKNAYEFGKANPKAIIGKLIASDPSIKSQIKEIMPQIVEICNEINGYSKDKIEKMMESFTYEENKKNDKRSWKLEDKQIVTRFSPEPNGYLHIGHAKAILINYKLAQENEGKFIVKFDDTNPENCKEEYVRAILKDIEWLGIKPNEVKFVSEIMDKIHDYGRILIESGNAYVCTCTQEEMRDNRARKKECSCRHRTIEENLKLWNEMNSSMDAGKAVVRFKGDMKSLNTVMRDPVIFRIVDATHYRLGTRYRVWPTYDFENPISDAIFGITHVFRSKEFELRREFHERLLETLGFKSIKYYEFARLDLEGYPVSKRLIRPHIESGLFSGFDDPRLVTLAGLRERGIPPEAIGEFVLSFGLSKQEVKTDLKKLFAFTRKYYDPRAPRYFAVRDPIRIRVKDLGEGEIEIPLHPTDSSFGKRKIKYGEELFIDKKDFERLKEGNVIRLKELKNVVYLGENKFEISPDQSIKKEMPKIQWISEGITGELIVFDTPFIEDKINPTSEIKSTILIEKDINPDKEIVQFERIGFAKLKDKTSMKYFLIV